MIKMKSLIATAVILALTACDGGDEEVSSSANSIGTLEIVGNDFFAGAPLSVTLNDTDGVVDESVTYVWVRDPDGTPVELSTTSSYTLTEADEESVIQVTALYSTDSGLFKSEQVSTIEINPTLDVSAFIIKGPVDAAVCNIFEVDATGVAGATSQASSTSDATGAVTFTDVNFTGNGLISCTGGTYTDEATGTTLNAPTLRAVVDVVEDVVVEDVVVDGVITELGADSSIVAPDYIVSPLTELAVQAAGTDLTTAEAEAAIINANFGIRFDTTETSPTIIGVDTLGADGADDADQYGAVLALISQLDADNADSDIGTLLTELSTDLSDGSFSTETQTTFETAQANLETTSVVAGLVTSDLFIAIGASIGFNNDPVVAIIEGDLEGTINSSATTALTGTATVIDPNADEAAFVVQTDVQTDFGTFSIAADGSWTYTVDTINATVAALDIGESVNDLVTITSIDETSVVIDVRVAALTQVAEITNIAGDTGELRFNVDDLRQGKLSVSFSKDVAIGSDNNSKDAYIALYGSSGSNSESLIDLRIQGDQIDANGVAIAPRFLVRNTDSAAYSGDIVTAPFVEEQFYDIDISWDLDAAQQITLSIDGEVIGGGAFSTAAEADSDFVSLDQWFVDGVQSIQFRFGDNGTTIPFGSYYIDDIEVYSDAAGTTKVFEDDFEIYTVGETLDGVDSDYSASIYTSVETFDPSVPVGPTPAVFFELTESINSDEVTPLTGTITVQDQNDGEDSIIASTITATYGDFSILADGSWTYTLDSANTTIAALERGDFVLETITVESFDGTTADLVITVLGTLVVDTGVASNGLGSPGNQFANLTDVAGTSAKATDTSINETSVGAADGTVASIAADDTGEFRIKLDNVVEAGRMTVQILKGTDSDVNIDGFILIGGVDTGSNESLLDLRLDQSGNHFDIRNGSSELGTFNTGTIYNVEISWDASTATTALAPTIAISIDGIPLFSGDSTTNNLTEAENGVQFIQFRVADGDDISRADFKIDELVVYETQADGTELIVLEDDFEIYTAGDSLDSDANTKAGFELQQTPSPLIPSQYDSNSFSVVVGKEADVVATGLGNAGNQFANLTDVAGTSAKATDTSINETSVGAADGTVASIAADDTGEFRIKLDNVVEAGRMTVQILKGTDSDVNIDGFILIGGVDTGSNESLLDLRLDQSGNHFDIRNGSSELGTFNTGTIYNVEISWDASTATTALAPTIAISIDGIPLFSGDSTTNNLTEAENGVQFIQFRVADGDDISRADFKIDELVVYETQADGTELIVLEDDFEIYTAGDSLDSDANTKAGFELQQTPSPLIPSQYDSNSFSVIVDAE